MNKIGIIGGLGPESTLEYYKRIIYGYRNITGDENYPQLYVNSVNMTEILSYLTNNDYEKLADVLTNEINKLKTIGADYVAIASNTPHVVIDELIKKLTIPLISIVEETCKFAKNNNLKKVLLTGTIFTMSNNFYKKAFDKYNIECIVPEDNEKKIIHNVIFPNLENGIIIEEDKLAFMKVCNNIIKEKNIDGIILGCTELPLMINQDDFDISVLDTMEIHIKSILEKLM
ncbi:MAG: amino acid racemase [Dysgonamonadaceae bacterium]|jgi:aspartate racemase|nr:amino acid racemase [Dysgonamonadaceae bacterium]